MKGKGKLEMESVSARYVCVCVCAYACVTGARRLSPSLTFISDDAGVDPPSPSVTTPA